MSAPAWPGAPPRAQVPLTTFVRFLLWDYERGSLAYELALTLIFLLLVLVPPAWWGDPLVAGAR